MSYLRSRSLTAAIAVAELAGVGVEERLRQANAYAATRNCYNSISVSAHAYSATGTYGLCLQLPVLHERGSANAPEGDRQVADTFGARLHGRVAAHARVIGLPGAIGRCLLVQAATVSEGLDDPLVAPVVQRAVAVHGLRRRGRCD